MCVSGGEDTQGVGASAGHVAWELSSSEENILFLVCFIIFFFGPLFWFHFSKIVGGYNHWNTNIHVLGLSPSKHLALCREYAAFVGESQP